MAALPCTVGVTNVASGTAAKTILQVTAPANQRLRLKRLSIGGRGIVNTDPPILVELLRQSSAGTMTAATPVSRDGLGSETIQSTAQHSASAEPTAGNVIARYELHPQSALVIDFQPGEEPIVPGGGRVGVRVTTGTTQNLDCQLDYEE